MQLKEHKMQLPKKTRCSCKKKWRIKKLSIEERERWALKKKDEIEKIEKDALWKMRFRWNKWDLEKYKRVNNKSV